MNIIENIGKFIINNKEIIEMAVFVIIAILIIIFAVKLIVNARRKRDLLSQINQAVSEINTNVNNLGDKGKDVIYIDNRTAEKIPEVNVVPEHEATEASSNENTDESVNSTVEPVEEPEEIIKKYFDRDCGIDKNGKTYTIEELEKQIKD